MKIESTVTLTLKWHVGQPDENDNEEDMALMEKVNADPEKARENFVAYMKSFASERFKEELNDGVIDLDVEVKDFGVSKVGDDEK